MTNTALFAIDLQAELISIPDTAVPHADRIREAAVTLLNRARNEAVTKPIIVTVQHSESPDDPHATLIPGSEAWKLVFPPAENDESALLVHKTTPDTFESNPQLAAQLQSQGVQRILAFGVQSDICVDATCQGAIKAGFDVYLLQGAHSTYANDTKGKSAQSIEREIERELEAIGVRIIPWETYTF